MTEAQKAAVERLSDMDRANLFLNHGRAKHSDSCWRCDEPWPCLTMRVVIDADHEWAQWHDKWIAALDLMGSQAGRAARAEAKVREQAEEIAHLRDRDKLSDEAVAALTTQRNAMAEEIERLKKERDGAVKQALEQHRIVQDQGWELRAANGRTERAEKALRSVLTHPDTTGRLQELVSEALRPAAPEPTPSEKCPYCGLTTCRYGADPTSTCHAKGDSCRCSEQPDLPLGHEFVAGHPHPAYQSYCALRGIFGLCGQPESAHRREP